MNRDLYGIILKKPLIYLLVFGLAIRVLIILVYNGVTIAPDSKTYIELSAYLSNFNLDGYSGRRTPGFPLLIALCGGNLYLTTIAQQILGLFSIFFIYDFSFNRTRNKEAAFWITFITSSFLHFILYEFAILTETLSLFLLTFIFWLIQKFNLLDTKAPIIFYFVTSVAMGFLYLTRPMFIYLPLAFAIFLFLKNFSKELKNYTPRLLIIIALPALCFHGWCSVNKKNIGYYTSTYFLGLNLSQASTHFFHKTPDKDHLIRDIFVKHRDSIKQIKPEAVAMSVWYAYDELKEKTKLSDHDLCNELGIISKRLIKENPLSYAKQVFISWIDFWNTNATFAINKEKIAYTVPKYIIYGIWKIIQQYLLILFNMLFIVFSVKKAYKFILSKFKIFDIDLLIAVTVIGGSLAQALVTYGDNSRFSVPYLPLIVYFVTANLIPYKSIIYTKCKKYFN